MKIVVFGAGESPIIHLVTDVVDERDGITASASTLCHQTRTVPKTRLADQDLTADVINAMCFQCQKLAKIRRSVA